MHIVHVQDHHYEHTGYEVTYLSREQAKLGHRVTVVTSDEYIDADGLRTKRADEYEHDRCTIVRLPGYSVLGPRLWLSGLEKTLLRLKPNVIHCHGIFDITSARTARARRSIGCALVCDCHAAAFNTKTAGLARKLCYAAFRETAGRVIKGESAAISAIGEEEQEFVCRELRLAVSQVPIMRLGVDTQVFQRSQAGRASIRAKLGLKETDVLLLHVGSIRPSKRLPLLIAALETPCHNDDRIHLLIVGSGSQEATEEIRTAIEAHDLGSRVHLWPSAGHGQLSAYYSAGDIAVWPGDISTAALEAMACELPLIATDTAYNRALQGRSASYLFAKDDAEGLSAHIVRLTGDEELRVSSGACARKQMMEHYDAARIAHRHVEVYKIAIANQFRKVCAKPESEVVNLVQNRDIDALSAERHERQI